ncbi:LLM class flavin-dependent oxidoreductase [Deinococcus cellulosilyticus]|uniref:Monooxygenase n=1 Tax=Deinococcus cellulosilyticus (strain DSM 18568 / NBRC 106333 / KACC 11606 / 5516J-15) TaxID=1223518 RepID=A0A511MW90_DEIC1|nr:LLM class flavin-dependent oxidoreductase [Deinococcus cellulosilyticus]GEM44661.1 monooxygenase [Deinococcus cellulosilyticus NBRC 106333 = KACC 11606]
MSHSSNPRQIKLGAFLMTDGHHIAAWRHPQANPYAHVSFEHFKELAQKAEAAKFDTIFFADSAAAWVDGEGVFAHTSRGAHFEPLTLLSALATVTTHIGLIATQTTTYNEPYHLARKFASLDQISGGRAGWNLVTSANGREAFNFNRDAHVVFEERYDRAHEFAEVVTGLWDSWEDDAFIRDKESGLFSDPEKSHVLSHVGKHFKVRGPLNVARSPQGRPVIVQAGSSEEGKELAAATAEVVFTAQQTLQDAQHFYNDLKGRLAKYGRSEDDLKIMPGVLPYVGRTQQEARDKFDLIQSLVLPKVGLSQLSNLLGADLSGYDIDGPVPDLPLTNNNRSRQALLVEQARREGLTIRDLYLSVTGGRGHWQLIGTPEQIADELEERFLNRGADGFNVMGPVLPAGLDDFIELVIPELRRRGMFRHEYEGRTLRENLGLKRPENSFKVKARQLREAELVR